MTYGYALALALMSSIAVAQSVDYEMGPDYNFLINHSEIGEGIDNRPELGRCVRYWDSVSTVRVGWLSLGGSARGMLEGRRVVLLEIGNSGFPQYRYVHIENFLLKSSFGVATDVSNSELGSSLRALYDDPSIELRGDADSEVDDGNCYFLTVGVDGVWRGAAIYGTPKETVSGLLVEKVLEVAKAVPRHLQ